MCRFRGAIEGFVGHAMSDPLTGVFTGEARKNSWMRAHTIPESRVPG